MEVIFPLDGKNFESFECHFMDSYSIELLTLETRAIDNQQALVKILANKIPYLTCSTKSVTIYGPPVGRIQRISVRKDNKGVISKSWILDKVS